MKPASPVVSGTIYGVILNDTATLARMGDVLKEAPYNGAPVAPVLYIKPANTIVGEGAEVALPPGACEVEIGATVGVVFAREVSRAALDEVTDVVKGYIVVADLSLPHTSYYRPAIREKCFDGACPTGSRIASVTEVGSLDSVALRTYVDDTLVECRNLSGLVRHVPQLVAENIRFHELSQRRCLARGRAVAGACGWHRCPGESRGRTNRLGSIHDCHGERGFSMKYGRIAWNGSIHEVTPAPAGRVRLADGRTLAETDVVWLPPVEVGTVFALGLNYADHARELAFKAPETPLVFLKGPNTIIGHRAYSRRPAEVTYMHYECELAVLIGQHGYRIPKASAMQYVAGYTVANDYAIRDFLENYYRPNLRVKNRDGCTPLGPWLVERDDIADPMALTLTTRGNGQTTQTGTTADMIFDIPMLIEYLSSFMTLSPGDVILTGTPQGLADVSPGSVVETSIEGIGTLINTVLGDQEFFADGRD